MSAIINETEIESMLHNGVEVQTWIHNDVEVYSAGKMVTYYVDTDVVCQEKIKKGHSCLSPATFTPTKSGWTFVGWREDAVASGSVLSEKTMERSPITLYAVFSQTVTATYNGNGNTGGSTSASTGNKYYNNGNVENASIKLANNGFTLDGYSFVEWAMGSISGTKYSAGFTISLSQNTIFYAVWIFNATSAFTFTANSNRCESIDSTYNEGFVKFNQCGSVGSYASLETDGGGRYIRLKLSRSGKLKFYLKANNTTGSGLDCNCSIHVCNSSGGTISKHQTTLKANTTVTIQKEIAVSAGQIINIGNDGGNAYMTVLSGSYIQWAEVDDVVFKAVSQELTSQKGGSIFGYSTITQSADYFNRSGDNVTCQKAGTYKITANVTPTAGSGFHCTVYKNSSEIFSTTGSQTNTVTLAKGDNIRCNSSASNSQNGYVTLIIRD